MLKIIALLLTRNEKWILPTYFSSVSKIVDEIIVLDDNSKDGTQKYLNKQAKTTVHQNSNQNDKMSSKRQQLLRLGREARGTHFVCLDADEAFSNNFTGHARKRILSLKPREKLSLQWIALWKSIKVYRDDQSAWSNNYKDFVFADHVSIKYPSRFLSEPRTPGRNDNNLVKVNSQIGVVLHFQFLYWDQFQIKQAWYRCLELANSDQSARSINSTYSITLDDPSSQTSFLPDSWIKNITLPTNPTTDWHVAEIMQLFNVHGIDFFEDLNIWHISKLNKEFIKRTQRRPGRNSVLHQVFVKVSRVFK